MNQKALPLDNPLLNSEAWEEWKDYQRRERKKPIKAGGRREKAQLELLLQYDIDTQGVIIKRSLDKEWAGLFPIKDTTGGWDEL